MKVAGKAACFTKRSAFLCAALVAFVFSAAWWFSASCSGGCGGFMRRDAP